MSTTIRGYFINLGTDGNGKPGYVRHAQGPFAHKRAIFCSGDQAVDALMEARYHGYPDANLEPTTIAPNVDGDLAEVDTDLIIKVA